MLVCINFKTRKKNLSRNVLGENIYDITVVANSVFFNPYQRPKFSKKVDQILRIDITCLSNYMKKVTVLMNMLQQSAATMSPFIVKKEYLDFPQSSGAYESKER